MNALENLIKQNRWEKTVGELERHYPTQVLKQNLDNLISFLENIELPENWNVEIEEFDFFDPEKSPSAYIYFSKENSKHLLSIFIELYTTPIYYGDEIYTYQSTLIVSQMDIYFYDPYLSLKLDIYYYNFNNKVNISEFLKEYDNLERIIKKCVL